MDLTKYRNKLIGSEDERAVSPVIGVILMVAITVILAAVIAAFVLDIGDLDDGAPNAQISYETNSDYDGSDTDLLGTFSHDGGDAISAEEIEIRIDNIDESGDDELLLNSDNSFGDSSTDIGSFDSFEVGKSLEIDSDDDDIGSEDTYEVTVVHEPSNSIIFENEFTAAQF